MAKNKITTLLPVGDYEKTILENSLIDYYLTSNNLVIFDDLLDVIDTNDYIEIIQKYDSNMKKSVEYLSKFFVVLNDKIELGETRKDPITDEFLLQIMKNNHGVIFPLLMGSVMVNYNQGIELSSTTKYFLEPNGTKRFEIVKFHNNFDITILEKSLKNYLNSYYLNIPNISDTHFKFVFGETEQSANEYLNAFKKLLERIKIKDAFIKFSEEMNKTLEKIEANHHLKDMVTMILGKGRATIRDTLKDSIVIKKNSNGFESIGLEKTSLDGITDSIALQQLKEKNAVIDRFNKVFLANTFIDEIEVDKEISIVALTDTLSILERQKIHLDQSINLKIRKLGNYNASGLEIQMSDGSILVAIDQRKPYSLLHEIGHVIYENKYAKDEELKTYSDQLINLLKQKMSDIPEKKKEYFYKPTEIFARTTEVAYMLNLMGYYDMVKENPYSEKKFFTPEMMKKIKNLEYDTNGLIKKFMTYFDSDEHNVNTKGIYFNLQDMTIQELTTMYVFLQDNFKYVYDANVKKEIDKKQLDEKVFETTIKEQISTLVNKPKVESAKTVMLKFERNAKNIDVNANFYVPFVDKVNSLYKLVIKDNRNGNTNEFDTKDGKEVIKSLKETLFYKLIVNDKDINLYTNTSEFLSNIKQHYSEGIQSRKIRNLSGSLDYLSLKTQIEKLEEKQKIDLSDKYKNGLIVLVKNGYYVYGKQDTAMRDFLLDLKIMTENVKLYNGITISLERAHGSYLKMENIIKNNPELFKNLVKEKPLSEVLELLNKVKDYTRESRITSMFFEEEDRDNFVEKATETYKILEENHEKNFAYQMKELKDSETRNGLIYFDCERELVKLKKDLIEFKLEFEKEGRNSTNYARKIQNNFIYMKPILEELAKMAENNRSVSPFFSEKEIKMIKSFYGEIKELQKEIFPRSRTFDVKKESDDLKQTFTYENMFGTKIKNYFSVMFNTGAYAYNKPSFSNELQYLRNDNVISPVELERLLTSTNKSLRFEEKKRQKVINYLGKNYSKMFKQFVKEYEKEEKGMMEFFEKKYDKELTKTYFESLKTNVFEPFSKFEKTLAYEIEKIKSVSKDIKEV